MRILNDGKQIGTFSKGKFTTKDPALLSYIAARQYETKGAPYRVQEAKDDRIIERELRLPLTGDVYAMLYDDLRIGGFEVEP